MNRPGFKKISSDESSNEIHDHVNGSERTEEAKEEPVIVKKRVKKGNRKKEESEDEFLKSLELNNEIISDGKTQHKIITNLWFIDGQYIIKTESN